MDTGQKFTRKTLKGVEKSLYSHYRNTEKVLRQRVEQQLRFFAVKDAENLAKVKAGAMTQEAYLQWRTRQLTATAWVNSMANDIANRMTTANKVATRTITDKIDPVYKANVKAGLTEAQIVASLKLSNKQTQRYLTHKVTTVLPMLNDAKDKAWNMRHIKSALMQSVHTGESVPKIAKRLGGITGQNGSVAIRTARTAINSAHNGGRLEGYIRAADMGIQIDKQWQSAADNRVREAHALMDGETVGVREEFSNGLMFPQDPAGDAAEVYNCRCTMVAVPSEAAPTIDVDAYDLEELIE